MNVVKTLLLCLLLAGCTGTKQEANENTVPAIPFTMVKAFPHDIKTFTQGLTVHNGELYESTGQTGSWIAQVDITTGTQNKKVVLDDRYFGEGIAILHNKMYQLTWKSKIGFVYDIKSFQKLGEFNYNHEGWGITTDGRSLIVSDGTNRLRFLDTLSLKETSFLTVQQNGVSVESLNELEYIDGFVYANQWQTPYILKINPTNGEVVGRMDLSALLERILTMNPNADVLNGIAWENRSKTLLVTGKYWPILFALRFKEEGI